MFFLQRPSSYVGIDIGGGSLKAVELQNDKGRPRLITYGYMEGSISAGRLHEPAVQEKIVKDLLLVLQKARVTSKKVIAALPTFSVFSSVITLPQMSSKELESAIAWEAKKYVPMPIEEMVLDWKVIEESSAFDKIRIGNTVSPAEGVIQEKARKYQKIILTAAPQKLVNQYVALFKKVGLELVALETEVFALERSLVGHDKSPLLLVDFGATTTIMSVVVASVPFINRSVDLGGDTITKTLATGLNIDVVRAEQLKRDFGLSEEIGGSQIPRRIEFMLTTLVNEIRYVLNLWSQESTMPVEKVVLSGGSSFLPSLVPYLEKTLGTKVILGDPWARVMYAEELRPVLAEVAPRFSVSVGLAMRDIIHAS